MPRLTPERQEARQGVILAAARRVFVERGLHVATTHDVARAAGVPVGSIYTYFASKDELIRASILAANKEETESVLRNMQAAGTFRERLRRALAGWYAYTVEAPGVAAFLADVSAEAARRPLIRDLVARRRERVVMVATVLIQEGLAAGELRPGLNADLAARVFANLLDGIVLECLEHDGEVRLRDVERRVNALFSLS
ncbi:MAG: TetR/AcrR family transcriptional regulator [Candidatus Limnocylindrales bacterium]